MPTDRGAGRAMAVLRLRSRHPQTLRLASPPTPVVAVFTAGGEEDEEVTGLGNGDVGGVLIWTTGTTDTREAGLRRAVGDASEMIGQSGWKDLVKQTLVATLERTATPENNVSFSDRKWRLELVSLMTQYFQAKRYHHLRLHPRRQLLDPSPIDRWVLGRAMSPLAPW